MGAVKDVLKRAELKKVLASTTEGDAKATALHTGNDIIIGAIGGGLFGAIFPKAGFWTGIILTSTGYYFNVPSLPAIGVGMTAASLGTFVKGAGFSAGREAQQTGVAGAWAKAKSRMGEFKNGLLSVTFIDKLLP